MISLSDHEGLKFIKDDIKVSKEGLSKISDGEEMNKYLAIKKEDIDVISSISCRSNDICISVW